MVKIDGERIAALEIGRGEIAGEREHGLAATVFQAGAGEVDGRDGRVVNRGGAGQRIPGFVIGSPQEANGLGGRTIYFDRTPTSLASLNVDLLTAAALQSNFGVTTATEAAESLAPG